MVSDLGITILSKENRIVYRIRWPDENKANREIALSYLRTFERFEQLYSDSIFM